MEKEYIIRAKKLRKVFDGIEAVRNIDFVMEKGVAFGMLGPNGAGKTTTIRMISCYLPPTAGTLEVFGLSVTDYPRQIKARLGVCQQEDNLDPDLDVYRNLLVYSRYFNMPKQTADRNIDKLLDFVGLSGRRKSRIMELSGGMKRRLIVARSLLNDPELLILDEPTTGLDPQARNQVWENLLQLKTRGTSFLLTTHYMEEAARLCDKILIMDEGKIVAEGTPAELIARIIGKYVVEVTTPDERIEQFVRAKSLPYEKTPSRLLVFTDASGDIFDEFRKNFCDASCSLRVANLEDVFLKLTGRELKE